MKIAIATAGRFHVLDLARELSALGHEVMFYSILPKSRAVRFGLPSTSHRGLLPWLLPLVAMQRFGGRKICRWVNPWLLRAADWLIARRLDSCDVFIGMSGICVESARVARERHGAKVFIERGSRHILSQKAILDELSRLSPTVETVPDYAVKRHLASVEQADVVVIPARHAAESFLEQDFPPERLFRNPYGVDLDMFAPTPAPDGQPPTLIYVGTWSYRKGCDLLVEAIGQFEGRVNLWHVGGLGDAPLPDKPWFRHQDPVPQWQLREWYARAWVFVVASREEGLALVQAQALACGLSLVCTDRSGGEDLAELIGLREGIFIVPHDDVVALAEGVAQALRWAQARFLEGTERDLLGRARYKLSWQAYGKRYINKIIEVSSNV